MYYDRYIKDQKTCSADFRKFLEEERYNKVVVELLSGGPVSSSLLNLLCYTIVRKQVDALPITDGIISYYDMLVSDKISNLFGVIKGMLSSLNSPPEAIMMTMAHAYTGRTGG